ncbi:MAG: RICIN domain-containing protein [Clostridia bacterium]|nr:RICIN domain-containing protein [Clostridia bacterium]
MKKKKSLVRVISMMLILALMLAGMPVIALDSAEPAPTTAPVTEDGTPAVTEASLPATEENLLGAGELTYAELQTAVLAPADIPDALPAGTVEAKGHVNRVYEQEEGLSHLLFQNRDGGKTAYFYGKPIKYVAEDGSVRDKSKTLIAVNKTYDTHRYDIGVEDNNIRQYYAADPAVGMLIEVGGGTIRVIPQAAGGMLLVPYGMRTAENTFVYDSIFGNTTSLVYTPQLSGVKEDILLRSYAGVSDFTFTYYTSGLSLVEVDGTYTFVDESGLPQATLGAILITDAEGKSAMGSLTVTETTTGTYTVIVHADRDFLTSPDTVYPVTVDPSVTISETVSGTAAILDYGLYSSTVIPSDANYYHYLGYANNGSAIGRVIYKFPHFISGNSLTAYTHLNGYQISAADLIICGAEVEAEGYPAASMTIYPLTMGWSSSTNAFSDTPLFNSCKNGTPIERGSMGFDYVFSGISVTDIIKAWANYNVGDTTQPNPAYGFVLVDDEEFNTGYAKKIYAAEGPEEDVFFAFDYSSMPAGKCYLNNVATGRMLQRTGNAGTVGYYSTSNLANQQWIIEYIGAGQYTIRLQCSPNLYLTASGSNLMLTTATNLVPTEAKWLMTGNANGYVFTNVSTNTVLCNDGSSLSLVTARESNDSNYANTTWIFAPSDGFVMLEDIFLPDEMFVYSGSTVSLAIQSAPSNASMQHRKCYTLTTTNSAFTFPFFNYIKAPDVGGYTTITVTYKPAQITRTIFVKSGILPEGEYRVQNVGTNKFMESNLANVSPRCPYQTDFRDETQFRWHLIIAENGGYIIKTYYNNEYLTVEGGSTQDGARIIQDSAATGNHSQWNITRTDEGRYRITPKSAANMALGIPLTEDRNGTYLKQNTYTNDSNYRDEWYFISQIYSVVNYYDESFLDDPDLLNNISSTIEFVDKIYRQVGAMLVMDGTPTYYNSIADTCPITDPNSPCTSSCGADSECVENHHKNETRIWNQLQDDVRENNHIYILWANRPTAAYCTVKDNVHQSYNALAVAGGAHVLFFEVAGDTLDAKKAGMGIILLHELAHTFGFGHGVHEGLTTGTPFTCVMGANESNLYDEYKEYLENEVENDASAFCDSCRLAISNLAPYAYHPGT